MKLLAASNMFSDIFEWFASLSAKLPEIDYKTYFVVVAVLLVGIGVIVGLTFLGSYRFKLLRACKKIIRYLAGVDAIDNDNFGDFTAQCFSTKAPSALRDCWVQYLGVRFGYPSDIVSEQNVYDKQIKRVREIRANVYIAIALVLIAIFAFWGYGRLDGNDMGVIFLAGLLLSGVVYIVLVMINKALSAKCLDAFSNMQEDLDSKVVFQVEKSFATDSSPLADLSAIIDEIVARNTAKEIGFEFADEQTPIEELIEKAADMPSEQAEAVTDEDVLNAEAEEIKPEDESAEVADTENIEVQTEGAQPVEAEEITTADETVLEAETDEAAEANESDENVSENENPDGVAEQPGEEENVDSQDNAEEKEKTEPEEEQKEQSNVALDDTKDDGEAPAESDNKESADGEQAEQTPENEKDGEETKADEPVADASDKEEPIQANEPEQKPDEAEPANEDLPEDTVSQEEPLGEAEQNEHENNGEQDVKEEADVKDEPEKNDGSVPDEQKKNKGSKDGENDSDDDEPLIRYVVDGPSEDEEIVKPAQLVKMPNLVDYMVAQNVPAKVKMKVANQLMDSLKKFESSNEDKKIIMDCVKKLMADLQHKR